MTTEMESLHPQQLNLFFRLGHDGHKKVTAIPATIGNNGGDKIDTGISTNNPFQI